MRPSRQPDTLTAAREHAELLQRLRGCSCTAARDEGEFVGNRAGRLLDRAGRHEVALGQPAAPRARSQLDQDERRAVCDVLAQRTRRSSNCRAQRGRSCERGVERGVICHGLAGRLRKKKVLCHSNMAIAETIVDSFKREEAGFSSN